MSRPSALRRTRISTTAGLIAGGVPFTLVLLNFTSSLTRTATGSGYASNFFDLQARALLDGRWTLPEDSLGIEAFISNGATYTYFPPFPSLVRMPVLLTTDLFDGRLTILSMAVAWIVFAAMTTRLVWLLRLRLSGREEVTVRDGVLVATFLALATGGTTLTYDVGQPWVYHEVYLWASAGAVGAAYWLVRVLATPERSSIAWLGVFCVICVGSRTTAGWAVCLTVMAVGLWIATGRPIPGRRGTWWMVVLAGALPWIAGMALNYHKFGHPLMFPLEDQVFTELNAHRREALEVNGGTITGPQFFTTSFMAYFRLDGIRFVDYFPWITLPAEPARAYGGAFLDQTYRTGSVTAFMPMLLLLTGVACVALLLPRARLESRHLRPVLLSMILITGGVMGYGYLAFRYVSDFVPALVVGGAIATALLCRWAQGSIRWFHPVAGLLALGAVWSVAAHVLVGYSMSAFVHEGAPLVRYLSLQQDLSPGGPPVSHGSGPPRGGETDELYVRGNCDVLYVNTGDAYHTWVVVEQRDARYDVWIQGRHTGSARLARVSGNSGTELWIERTETDFRLVVKQFSGDSQGFWQRIPVDHRFQVGVRNRTDIGFFEFSPSTSRTAVYSPSTHYDDDWRFFPSDVRFEPDVAALKTIGITVTSHDGPDLPLCERIRDTSRAGR